MTKENSVNAHARNWIDALVHKTLVFENVTLYGAHSLRLPQIPRIGEVMKIYGNLFSGTVAKVTYAAEYNTLYEDHPDVNILELEEEPFNFCKIRIDLEKSVENYEIDASILQEERFDKCWQLLASKKERPEDFKKRLQLKNDENYRLDFLIHWSGREYISFDPANFDQKYPTLDRKWLKNAHKE